MGARRPEIAFAFKSTAGNRKAGSALLTQLEPAKRPQILPRCPARHDTHRHESKTSLRSLQLIQAFHRNDRAARAQSMAERDRASVWIDYDGYRSSLRQTPRDWAAKASLDSITSMSAGLSPARCNASVTAGIGPVPISEGSTPEFTRQTLKR